MTPREIDEIAHAVAERLKSQASAREQRLMDVDQIAHFLNVSPNTIKNWGIPSLRIGKRVLYDPHDALAFLKRRNDLSEEELADDELLQKIGPVMYPPDSTTMTLEQCDLAKRMMERSSEWFERDMVEKGLWR